MNDVIDSLVVAAGARPDDMARVVDERGAEAVAGAVAAEIAARCLPLPGVPDVAVQFDVTHGPSRLGHTFSITEKGVTVTSGRDPHAPMWIGYELADLARELYGPPGGRPGRTRRVELRLGRDSSADRPDPKAWLRRMDPVARATRVLLAALDPVSPGLAELAVRYGTDKNGGLHWFAPCYERHFAELRAEPVRLLEIGIGGYEEPHLGGGSLRMWRRYFRRGLVYGVDIHEKSLPGEPRITTLRGDQSDADFMRDLARRHGPFDVIIDDGSHRSDHVIGTFGTLFPFLRPGGYYVVEDTQFSYWPGWGGDAGDLDSPRTSVGALKELVDGLHHEDLPDAGARGDGVHEHVGAVHFYRGIAFVEKAVNSEGTLPPWIPRFGTATE
ncbi:hypothetical protein [Actinomadura chokoriensis]|uniref:Methyltransferase MycE N-terminal domain-containing protein n=1 Tax=Actinomadura chokoriensis TaxID=454156 RepID=A0ABV4R2N3_9ACTN